MLEPVPKDRRAKITAEDAREIRRLFAAKLATKRQLAERFGLTYEGVRHVLRGHCWKDA
jgi:hypothetical protein